MKLNPVYYVRGQKFFCFKCDYNIVDSEREETGHFYSVAGHTFKLNETNTHMICGDFHQVVFAVCSGCEKEDF